MSAVCKTVPSRSLGVAGAEKCLVPPVVDHQAPSMPFFIVKPIPSSYNTTLYVHQIMDGEWLPDCGSCAPLP